VGDLASSFKVSQDGKTYTFRLKDNVYFSDNKPFTAESIPFNFRRAEKRVLDKHTVSYILKDQYVPFLVTLSKPIFKNHLVGLGEYVIQNIELNSGFVKTLQLRHRTNRFPAIRYTFYPTEEALKIGFVMGEVNRAVGLTNDVFEGMMLSSFPKTKLLKTTTRKELVTIFYNTRNSLLSDVKLRNALTYALPDVFPQGERTHIPYPKRWIYANEQLASRRQDIDHSLLLLEAVELEDDKKTITMKVLKKYEPAGRLVASEWKKLGFHVKVELVDRVPREFQIYLGDFILPNDPDQYTLWHSTSPNNITKFKNLRVDKLLEDGRRTVNSKKRVEIYKDFQKYLLEDSPAAFLYFPYKYTLERK
jgi:peptide/nickel transport system substrate-binding protein